MDLGQIIQSVTISWGELFPIAVNFVAALVLIFIGLLVAKGLGKLTGFVLKAIQVDSLAEIVGFSGMLQRANIKQSLTQLCGGLVFWLTALVVIVSVLRLNGIETQPALIRLLAHIAVVLIASLILGVGLFLAALVSNIIKVILANFGLEGSRGIYRTIYYVIIIFAFLAALSELGFDLNNLAPQLGVIIGFPALAAAIAFGLGCKDMAADFFHNLFKGR